MSDMTYLKEAKGLKFCHLNVRSIINKLDQFRLHFESSNIDIITISETWLVEGICSSILQMKGYQLFRWDRTWRQNNLPLPKKGGGLAIYVRKETNFTPKYDISLNCSMQHCEIQRLELCSDVQKNIVVFNVYRPPSGKVDEFLERLELACENEASVTNKELVFLGDYNINYSAKRSPDTKKLVTWQNRLGLSQRIKTTTRASNKSCTLIDLIITNIEHCSASGTIDLHISDHVPVYLIKKKVNLHRTSVPFKGRSYIGYTKELLCDNLTNEIKTKFRNTQDPNECWELMEQFLTKFLDKFCPIKSFRTKENTPAWISHDIITLSKDRDSAWVRAKLSGREEDWAQAKQLRNWANNAIKAAKSDYLNNELKNNKHDPKKFWRNIKEVLPDESSGLINIKNPLTGDSLPKNQQAQVINDFFAGIGQKLAAKFEAEVIPQVENILNEDRLEIGNVCQVEVLKLIESISVNKSSGIDNVSSRVLKDFMVLSNREFTSLFNSIIVTGIFPDKWKIASVTPIPKVPNATNPSDLRPISLLPVPGKLLEKIITTKIENYLEDKGFFSDRQNGFRKRKSTSNAMSIFLDEVISGLNASEICLAAYLDVQKAFDTINHNILLAKLESSGLGRNLCSLLRNYLTNRKQKTRLFDGVSDLLPINIGVPQGSTLGPIMFIIYINDLPDILNHSKSMMYADDTVLYYSHCDRSMVRRRLQSDLNLVEEWCLRNRLSLNVSKTKIMSFMSDHKRKINRDTFRLFMRGKAIEEVENYKYLGVHVDNRLNGDTHYTKLIQTVGLKIRTFGKIRRFLDTSAALTVYKSTILPIIDYCDLYQNLWSAKKLKKLQKLQNWGLRIVYTGAVPKLDEVELHTKAGLTLLKYRRILHLLGLMYHRSKLDKYLDNRNLQTRQFDKIKFKVLNPAVKSAFLTPSYFGPQLWDLLPKDSQVAPTYDIFKFKVKGHIAAGLFNRIK